MPLQSVPLQSLNLRAALFRCLNELKKNGALGKDVMIRKSFFDDCKGERILELLVSFSTLVVRRVLAAAGHGGRACIAARLATAKTVTAKEQQSFLPLAVAHRASLTAILQKKKDLRERYKNFARILDAKEQELDRRFEAVVSTQDILDKNPIPEHTVARLTKLFEDNWQGDRKPVDVITQGEGPGEVHEMKDSLLDKPFSETWQQVSTGDFDGATDPSWQGFLKDLEERVANQEARLTDWRNFRKAIQRDRNDISTVNNGDSESLQTQIKDRNQQKQKVHVISPRKTPKKNGLNAGKRVNETSPIRPKHPRKEHTEDELKERDLVFSPRKSPRKSMWPVESQGAEASPIHSREPLDRKETENLVTQQGDIHEVADTPSRDRPFNAEIAEPLSRASSVDETDESGFSEISNAQLHLSRPADHTVRTDLQLSTSHSDQKGASSAINDRKEEPNTVENGSRDDPQPSEQANTYFTKNDSPPISNDDDSWISSLPEEGKQGDETGSQSPNEDDKMAEQIQSMTINAPSTPAKPKASLIERTRQSMAFASPAGLQNLLPGEPSHTPISPLPSEKPHLTTEPNGLSTLLERTRQSISLIPSEPKRSRKSMLDRRTSKVYPTNQFETPKRRLDRVTELTPPEELFSPGAGYDSVFKSRPKIALSPNPSPIANEYFETVDADGERGGDGDGMVGKGQSGESPLARMTAKV